MRYWDFLWQANDEPILDRSMVRDPRSRVETPPFETSKRMDFTFKHCGFRACHLSGLS